MQPTSLCLTLSQLLVSEGNELLHSVSQSQSIRFFPLQLSLQIFGNIFQHLRICPIQVACRSWRCWTGNCCSSWSCLHWLHCSSQRLFSCTPWFRWDRTGRRLHRSSRCSRFHHPANSLLHHRPWLQWRYGALWFWRVGRLCSPGTLRHSRNMHNKGQCNWAKMLESRRG